MSARAFALLCAFALALLPCAAPASDPDGFSLGRAAAPVTVIEYASLGCSHCGDWSREVFPEFKRRFIDTGKVHFVLREMLNGDASLAAAGFLTARCGGPAKYFPMVEAIFAAQPEIEKQGDDLPVLLRVAAAHGVTKPQVTACLGDHAALAALQARSDAHGAVDHVQGTPTFDVMGRRIEGYASLADLTAAIAAAPRRTVR